MPGRHRAAAGESRATAAATFHSNTVAAPDAPALLGTATHGVRDEIVHSRRSHLRVVPTYEPRREWGIGPLTGYRVRTVIYMVLGIIGLYLLQDLLWPRVEPADELHEYVWSWGSLLWLGAVIPGFCGLIGMLTFRQPRHPDTGLYIPQFVCWRIVSRGTNIEALSSTIQRCQREMTRSPLFPYVIEVVTDEATRYDLLPKGNDIRYLEVPSNYRTANGTLYKARGLQYALEYSPLPDDAWIVHLDEETQPTSNGIKGIARMIQEEEASGQLRVGQGAILYHRKWREHPILTLADMVRTGDDFARFHFQHRIGRTIFGLHGSYIVVHNDVEKSVGFDFGPVGSITEDAFWALVLMQDGGRARWCEGYLEEQSTQSAMDFIKQRRRWFQGLWLVSRHAPVKLRWRVCIGTNTALWAIAPFAMLYTVIHLFYGFEVRPAIRFLANFSFASFLTLYLIGLKANMDEHGIRHPVRRAWLTLQQIVLMPLFSLLESLGVLFAIFRPVQGFEVVKK